MKTKIKRLISGVVALTLLLCTLSACNYNGQEMLIGEWYSLNGKILDIRSDGTYKLEDDYGTGTWKYLDDGETIEFTDYLGSTIETVLSNDENGDYIDLGYWGKFYNVKDIENKETNLNGITVIINKTSCFAEDRAIIEYEDLSGNNYLAMIDTNGNILYKVLDDTNIYLYTDNAGVNVVPKAFSGVACIGNNIIDNSGKVILSVEANKEGYIQCWGDGLTLTKQGLIDINGARDIYRVLNEKGTIVQEIEITINEIKTGIQTVISPSYAGCGIFQIPIKDDDDTVLLLINANTGIKKVIPIRSKIEFVDNMAVYEKDNQFYSINTNFEEKLLGEYDYCTGNYLINSGRAELTNNYLGTVEYASVTNLKTNKTVEFKEYGAEQVLSIDFVGDYGLVKLEGKSGGNFFTIIDKEANMLFEPKASSPFTCFDGEKIIRQTKEGENLSVEYEVLDINGEKLSDFKLENKTIKSIVNDIIVAENGLNVDGYCYVDLNGNVLFDMLYE